MADLPVIQLPLPEEEQPKTLYARITNTNEPPNYDDIRNSNLSPEEKVRQAQYRTQAYQDDLDRQLHKDYARIGLGGLVSLVGALPIAITKNPVIGSAIGGGVYELGQGIMEGDEFPELMQRSGFGAAIGGAAGGVVSKAPQAAKFVNDLSGGKIGNALKPINEKITNSKLYDVLMTDIKAFNPNKQTMYHGSPADFNKFDNAYIGTGEGAQAHGYGHYAALDKDVAEGYRKRLGASNTKTDIKDLKDLNKGFKYNLLARGKEDTLNRLNELIEANKNIPDKLQEFEKYKNIIENFNENNLLPSGQLYKLSVPKDDVMLREGATFAQQPKKVQEALKDIIQNQRQQAIENLNLPIDIKENAINEFNTAMNYNPNNPMDVFHSWQRLQKLIGKENAGKLQKASLKDSLYTNDADIMGRTFYNNLGKSANDILSQKGIKGISYNGGIDGEAAVIFNPDDIDIVRKYYNQPNLYEQLTGKQNTGAVSDSLYDKLMQMSKNYKNGEYNPLKYQGKSVKIGNISPRQKEYIFSEINSTISEEEKTKGTLKRLLHNYDDDFDYMYYINYDKNGNHQITRSIKIDDDFYNR